MQDLHEYQPWEGYYSVRATEFDIISDLLQLRDDYAVLEIGCGNGFYSALFSPYVKKVYSGDLAIPDEKTHTMGITKAKGLLEGLNISNVALASFSGTALPFKDEVFNLVFTSSTLEHIADRRAAVREIKRVLRPKGKAVIIVPNFLTSIYSIFHMPLYLCIAIVRRLFKKKANYGLKDEPSENNKREGIFKKASEVLALKPHGEYKNLFDELCNSYPSKWESLLRGEGMRIVASRGTIILPWSLISVFSSRLGASLYHISKGFHRKIVSRYDLFKYFSYLICVVVEK